MCNLIKSAVELNAEIIRTHRIRMSAQTYRNRLHNANLRARKPAVRPPLSREHRRRRLQFSRNHSNMQLRHLRPILFTDESKFCVDFHDGRRNVWREKNERYRDCCVVEHNRFGGGSVMAWAGISVDGATELFIIPNGTLTAARYRDEILHPIVRPFAGTVGPECVLMDDNARPHRARVVDDYLEQESIERMEWPAYSHDLNPIEHAWDILQRRVNRRPHKPRNVQELSNALTEEWQHINQREFRRLVRSFPKRCAEVIRARGGHTHY